MKRLYLFSWGSGLALSLVSVPASWAQQAAPASAVVGTSGDRAATKSNGIEEVVVTAQRRRESAQKAALTVQVISSKALQNSGITSPLQLATVAPSVQIASSGPSSTVYIRGVGGYSSTAGTSPAVPYYIDGVYVSRSQSVSSEFYDVDRLEILKGPQGTLYGRNASGGAINILTQKPTLGVYSGHAEFEGGSYGEKNGQIAVNLPLSPTVALRLSGQVVDNGGYSSEGLGDDVHQSVRAKLLWQPNSDLTVLSDVSYGHIGGKGPAWVVLNRNVPGWYPWLDASSPQAQAYSIAHSPLPIPGFIKPSTPDQAQQDLDFVNLSTEINWRINDQLKLTVLPAFRTAKMQYTSLFSDTFFNGYNIGSLPSRPERSDQTSLEARVTGDYGRLKFVAGAFVFNEHQYEQFTVLPGYLADTGSAASYNTRSYAGFGQATYAILPHVRLIGGLRYTSDARTIQGTNYAVSPTVSFGPAPPNIAPCAFPAPTQAQCVVDQFAGQKTFTNVSWKGGVEADVLDNGLLYATISRGFKAGGFNLLSRPDQPGTALGYAPETLTAYEAGVKNRFLDNRLQLNVSGFYWDYKNHQEPHLTIALPGDFSLVYENAGASEIYGGTIDAVARPWTDGTLTFSAEYAQSRYTSFVYNTPSAFFNPAANGCHGTPSATPGFTNVDCSGFETLKTPKWTLNGSFTQSFDVGLGTLTPSVDATYVDSRWLGIEFTPIERAKSYTLINALMTFQPAKGPDWTITAFARNLTDARTYQQALVNPLSGLVTANIGAPRTFGARIAYNF